MENEENSKLGYLTIIIVLFCIFCLMFFMYNLVVFVTCLSSEGTPYFNKIVYACHFDDTVITQQIVHSDASYDCFRNGVRINCSEYDTALK